MAGLATVSSLALLKGSLTPPLSLSHTFAVAVALSLCLSLEGLASNLHISWVCCLAWESLVIGMERHFQLPGCKQKTENRKLTAHCRSTWPYFGPTLLWASAVCTANRCSEGAGGVPILCARPAEKEQKCQQQIQLSCTDGERVVTHNFEVEVQWSSEKQRGRGRRRERERNMMTIWKLICVINLRRDFTPEGEVLYLILGKSIASSLLPATVAVAKPLGNVFLVNGNGNCDGNKLRHCRFRSFDT